MAAHLPGVSTTPSPGIACKPPVESSTSTITRRSDGAVPGTSTSREIIPPNRDQSRVSGIQEIAAYSPGASCTPLTFSQYAAWLAPPRARSSLSPLLSACQEPGVSSKSFSTKLVATVGVEAGASPTSTIRTPNCSAGDDNIRHAKTATIATTTMSAPIHHTGRLEREKRCKLAHGCSLLVTIRGRGWRYQPCFRRHHRRAVVGGGQLLNQRYRRGRRSSGFLARARRRAASAARGSSGAGSGSS